MTPRTNGGHLGALLVALLLAGCAAPAPAAVAPAPDAPSAPALLDVLPDCGGWICWEPTVAALPDGALVATYGGADSLFRAESNATAFAPLAPPALPPGAPEGLLPGDETVQVDAAGRLYYSALLRSPAPVDPLGMVPVFWSGFVGIHVARSDDRGATWTVNTFVSMLQDATAPVVGVDRQFLGFGEGDDVYLVYWQYMPRTGVWVARSDDGGASFAPPVNAVPLVQSGWSGSTYVAVAPDGAVLVPHFASGSEREVRMAISTDRGATFTTSPVATLDDTPSQWPAIAVAPNGTLHLAWVAGGNVASATSTDGGSSWSEPVAWDAGGDAFLPPFLAADAEGAFAAWFVTKGDALAMRAARGTFANGTLTPAPSFALGEPFVIEGRDRSTDFATGALLPDGRVATIWADDAALRLALA